MLGEIVKRFKDADHPLSIDQLSRELGVDRTALEGMLLTLVRQGKLKEVELGSETCGRCSKKDSCVHLASGSLGKVYEVSEKTP